MIRGKKDYYFHVTLINFFNCCNCLIAIVISTPVSLFFFFLPINLFFRLSLFFFFFNNQSFFPIKLTELIFFFTNQSFFPIGLVQLIIGNTTYTASRK
jgi:hypothetical protein